MVAVGNRRLSGGGGEGEPDCLSNTQPSAPFGPLSAAPRIPEQRCPGIPCPRETECNGFRGMRANPVSWPQSCCRTPRGLSRVRQGHDETHLCCQDRAEPTATVPIKGAAGARMGNSLPDSASAGSAGSRSDPDPLRKVEQGKKPKMQQRCGVAARLQPPENAG